MQKGRVRNSLKGDGRDRLTAAAEFGIKALEAGRLTSKQLEAGRMSLSKGMNRAGDIRMRIFPHKPITRKPAEVRMGKGKGSVAFFVAPVRPGQIIYEVVGVPEETVKKAIRCVSKKLPIKTKMVMHNDYVT